ncbi:MAG: hypothetical protein HN348_13015 [Proteobacteria bacterium]|nr:hypothetical protein [Pseudomonadota bacterium]
MLLLLLSLVALGEAPLEMTFETATNGPVGRRTVQDDASIVFFYGGEQRGVLGDCGCPSRPRGGLARFDSYVRASRKTNPNTPSLIINSGNWLDDTIGLDNELRRDVVVANNYVMKGLEFGGWDVLNVAYPDVPFLVERGFPDQAISASIRVDEGPKAYTTVEMGDTTLAITGISHNGLTFIEPEGVQFLEPMAALDEVIPQMRAEADIVVVLAFEPQRQTNSIVGRDDIDVFIEGGQHRNHFEPIVRGRTIWVRSRYQTMRMGELRLWIEDSLITKAIDRKIDLDDQVSSTRALLRLTRAQSKELDSIRQDLFGL